MTSTFQTILSLAIVATAATWLIWRALAKRKDSGCASEGCAAVSPEVKKLRERLKR